MKNLSALIIAIVAITFVSSCKKDNDPITKYVTRNIYIDSLYFPEANYIGDTRELINMDTLGDTLFFAAPSYSKLEFTNENNTTIRYIGGYRDTSLECTPIDLASSPSNPDNDTIYIYTFNYIKVPRKINYAILEHVEGSNVTLDTIVYYDNTDFVCVNTILYEEGYQISDYLEHLNEGYWFNPLTGKIVYDTNHIKTNLLLTLPKSNRRIYMMDIYPIKCSQIDSTQLVFLII